MSRPFTATAAADNRRRELGLTAAELADRAGVPYTTLRYFGLLSHDRQTLERLSVALDWPPEHLWDLWHGQEPAAGNRPG
jgi:transcriptional regulator with XRE-family HTH domain